MRGLMEQVVHQKEEEEAGQKKKEDEDDGEWEWRGRVHRKVQSKKISTKIRRTEVNQKR